MRSHEVLLQGQIPPSRAVVKETRHFLFLCWALFCLGVTSLCVHGLMPRSTLGPLSLLHVLTNLEGWTLEQITFS